jgi:methionyl-tRNA formyltransferase
LKNNKTSLRVVFMGTPGFAAHQLEALAQSHHKVVGVVTVPDKPAGRGLKVFPSAVKTTAEKLHLPVLQPEKLRDMAFVKQLETLQADVFVVVAFRMLPEVVWQMPKLGTFNLHASLLPQYRGAAPINWAIINGETRTGLTTFLIDAQIDTGNMLLQQEYPISPEDTAGTLHDKLMHAGPSLIMKTLDGLAMGQINPKPQKVLHLKIAPKIHKETCEINWQNAAVNIHNLVRGLHPMPLAWTTMLQDNVVVNPVKIHKTKVLTNQDFGEPGTVQIVGKTIHVQTGAGTLAIEQLQLPGKKPGTSQDFLNGWRGKELRFQ